MYRAEVAGFAIEDTGQSFARLGLAGIRVAVEQGLGGENHGGSRVTRLDSSGHHEGLLDGMETKRRIQALDCLDAVTIRLCGQHDLCGHQSSVEKNRGRTRFTGFSPEANTEEPFPPQHGSQ